MKKILLFGFFIALFSLLLGISGLTALYFWAARDLPSFKKITDYNPPLVTTVLARDGQVLGYFYKERRFLVDSRCPSAKIRLFFQTVAP